MAIVNYQNLDKVQYFDLEKYVQNIKIKAEVLEHLQETGNEFDKYLKYLLQYDSYAVIHYLIDSFNKECINSQAIENHYIKSSDILNNNVFFDTLSINHNRIHSLHNFVTKNDKNFNPVNSYRNVPIRVSKFVNNEEFIFWYGAEACDLKNFMNDFIKIYKDFGTSVINSNPFLKSALLQLLFIRIHPYTDGNGRTARLIHNIKFTDSINKIYNMKLKICPLNLSASILINKPTYANRLDSIYFDLKNDTNEAINRWFEFILNMYDEQLYYNDNRIKKLEYALNNIADMKNTDNSDMLREISKMKIKKY